MPVETSLDQHPAARAWLRFRPESIHPEKIEGMKEKKPEQAFRKPAVYRLIGVETQSRTAIAKKCHHEKAR